MKRSDLPGVAQALAELGQLLARDTYADGRRLTVAEAAWHASHEFEPGQQAARLEPSNGRRMENVTYGDGTTELVDVPHDPAGEIAVTEDRTRRLHDRYMDLMGQADGLTEALRPLLDELLPPQPNVRTARCGECGMPHLVTRKRGEKRTGTDVALEGWCSSCYRDGQRLQPIETDRRGNRYYRDLCRWCGGFKAKHKAEPPLELLEQHHRYGRVTTTQVARALTKAKSSAPTAKRKKKGKRG